MKRVEFIQQTVAEGFDITVEALLSKSRVLRMVVPRHVSVLLCRKYCGFSKAETWAIHHGGKRKGATTGFVNSEKAISGILDTDPEFYKKYTKVVDLIEEHDRGKLQELPERLGRLVGLLPQTHRVRDELENILKDL